MTVEEVAQEKCTVCDKIHWPEKLYDHDRQAQSKHTIRTFETGATRDTDKGKLDYEGFLNPFVLERFAQYMHEKRHMPDGSMRDSDNWQKGIPIAEYCKSLLRHTFEVWRLKRQNTPVPAKMIEDALCAVIFNAQGYLLELLATRGVNKTPQDIPRCPSCLFTAYHHPDCNREGQPI